MSGENIPGGSLMRGTAFTNTPVPPQTIQPCQSGRMRSRQNRQRSAKLVTYRKIQSPAVSELTLVHKIDFIGSNWRRSQFFSPSQSVLSELIPKLVFLCFRVSVQTFCIRTFHEFVRGLNHSMKKGKTGGEARGGFVQPQRRRCAYH